jgi:hypothetical protein
VHSSSRIQDKSLVDQSKQRQAVPRFSNCLLLSCKTANTARARRTEQKRAARERAGARRTSRKGRKARLALPPAFPTCHFDSQAAPPPSREPPAVAHQDGADLGDSSSRGVKDRSPYVSTSLHRTAYRDFLLESALREPLPPSTPIPGYQRVAFWLAKQIVAL